MVYSSYATQADDVLFWGGRLTASLQGNVESLFLGYTGREYQDEISGLDAIFG